MQTTNHDACLKFLESLNLNASNAYASIWQKDKTTQFFSTSDLSSLTEYAVAAGEKNNVFMPVALFAEPLKGMSRGKAEQASHIIGLFADIDILTPDKAEKKIKLPANKEVALEIIRKFPLAPTYIINSGRGIHLHWLYETPLKINSPEQLKKIKHLHKQHQKWLLEHFKQHSCSLDSVGDLVRVFRLPGTYNCKDVGNPLLVEVLEYNPDNRIDIARLEVKLNRYFPDKESIFVAKKDLPAANSEAIRAACAWYNHCIQDAEILSEPEWYAMQSIVGRCENADILAHEYSKAHPQYSATETTRKLEGGKNNAGPRTCKNIREACGGEEYCSKCPHFGKITSPIQLGQDQETGSMKQQLLSHASKLEFWHTANDTAYVTIRHDAYTEHTALHGVRFKKWLRYKLYKENDGIAPEQSVREVITTLEGKATYEGAEHEVYHRIAYYNNNLYIDLGTDDWSVIEVRADGWNRVTESPVRFIRSESVQPLPIPSIEGNITLLRDYIPCENDDDFKLIIGLLLGIYAPNKPYPVGVLTGLQGCGKSTRARAIIAVSDPSSAPMVNAPREERDVFASVSSRWLTTFDNVKRVKDNVSDALCCVSTGIAHSSRKYHTNMDVYETTEISRPVLITGIELRLRQDLRSRCIFFEFSPLEAKNCKTEKEYWENYNQDSPAIFGGVLNAISCALRNWQAVETAMKGEEMPRLADHTIWVSAAEEALGWESGTYRQLLLNHQREGLADSDMNSIFGQVMLGYLSDKVDERNPSIWRANELYVSMMEWAEKNSNLSKDDRKFIPRNPAAFSKKLRRAAQSLAYYGVEIEFDVNHESNKRAIRITLNKEFIEESRYRSF